MFQVKVCDVFLLLSVQPLEACKKVEVFCCGEFVVEGVELRSNSDLGENFINSSIDFVAMKHDFSMGFGDGCSEYVEGGGLACAVGSEEAKCLSFFNDEGIISDGDISIRILFI